MKPCPCGRGLYRRWFRGRARFVCLGSNLPPSMCKKAQGGRQLVIPGVFK